MSSSFFCFWATSKTFLPFACLPLPSLAPLHLAGPSSSCFFYPAVCVQGNYRSHASPKRYRTVSGHSSGRSRLPEHLKLLKTSQAVMSNIYFCLNTHWVRQKKQKNSKTRWWKNYMPKPQRIQKIPPKPRGHSSPMHYKSVATQLPYGFYMERHDETRRSG